MQAPDSVTEMLRAARTAEKEQTLFYRALASVAEERSDVAEIEAINGLLADEQHHLSRLTVRLLELGVEAPSIDLQTPSYDYAVWRDAARKREAAEIARYEHLLNQPLDEVTAAIVSSILEVERQHEKNLGGKYTEA